MTCLSEKAGQGYYYEDRLLIHKEQRAFETRGAISVERALEEAAAKNRPFRMKGFGAREGEKAGGQGGTIGRFAPGCCLPHPMICCRPVFGKTHPPRLKPGSGRELAQLC